MRNAALVVAGAGQRVAGQGPPDLFRRIVESANEGVWILDADGVTLFANPKMGAMLGYAPDELVGMPIFAFLDGAGHEPARRNLERRRAGAVDQLECSFVTRDGSRTWVLLNASPLLDAAGTFEGSLCMVTDIAERKDVEARLRHREQLLAEAQQVARLGSWEWDLASGELTWSDELYRLFGVDPDSGPASYERWLACVHPDDRALAQERVESTLATGEPAEFDHRVVLPTGDVRNFHCRCRVVRADGLVVGMQGTAQDITERKHGEEALVRANAELQQLATTDPLTGLPNRALFTDRLDQTLARARRDGSQVAVLFIDLDGFKDVNDALGHHCGDELLAEVARRLQAVRRRYDTIARLGGDEFAVIVSGPQAPDEAVTVAERLLSCFAPSFAIGSTEHTVTCSIGVALWPEDCRSRAELLQHADMAMYRAKAEGGNRFEMFQPAMTVAARERLSLVKDLRAAMDDGQLFLEYHPQVDLATGTVVAAEALVRWLHPERGLLAPAHFVPVAEESGLVVAMGSWVLEEACRQAAEWRDDLGDGAPLRVSVNVSARQLARADFPRLVADVLARTGTPPSGLELEVTESVLVDDEGPAVAHLRSIHALGVNLAIDDFGTGYSSLAYLRRFPVDRLKLDRSFVAGLHGGERRQTGDDAIFAAAVNLAHALGLEAVAEGVENEAQLAAVRALGCQHAQGYLWTRPLSGGELATWVLRRHAALGQPSSPSWRR